MIKRYSEEYIDQLLSKVDLMDLMKDHGVQVRSGTGRNHFYIADFCCGKKDFDNGRIKKDSQTYHCEACGTGGNAFHFLKEFCGVENFHEAVKELAHRAGMEIPEVSEEKKIAQNRKEAALRLAAEFYHNQNNFEYFLSRGISLDVLMKYKAGYAPGNRALRQYLHSKGFTKAELLSFKLINSNGLDRFYFRAIIPIYMNGKVIDLYGRSTNDEKTGIKHLYLYGDVTFLGGYDFIQKESLVTIYESFIDQLVAESHGIMNGTNPGGASKFGPEHASLLKKKEPSSVIVIFDGDKAGEKGSLEAGQLLDDQGIATYIGVLPEGQDPADIISKRGRWGFKENVKGRTFKEFKMHYELNKYDLTEIEKYVAEMKSKMKQHTKLA